MTRPNLECTIRPLYDYFTSVGTNGKTADAVVNVSLALTPKRQTLIERALFFVLRKLFPDWFPSTNIRLVITSLEVVMQHERPLVADDIYNRALFVQQVLTRIAEKGDKGLATLAKINQLRDLLPHSIHEEREKYRGLLAQLEARYFKGEELDPQNQLPVTLLELKRAGQRSWEELTDDMLENIFKKLGPLSICRARATCRRWNSIAITASVWNSFLRDNAYRKWAPAIPKPIADNLWEGFLAHQEFCRNIKSDRSCPAPIADLQKASHQVQFVTLPTTRVVTIKDGEYFDGGESYLTIDTAFHGNQTRSDEVMDSGMKWTQVYDEQYTYAVGIRHAWMPGIIITKLDKDGVEQERVFENRSLVVKQCSIHNNIAFLMSHNGVLRRYDLFNKTLTILKTPEGMHELQLLKYGMCIYRNEARDLVVLDLADPQAEPHVIPNSSKVGSVFTNTPTALIAEYKGYITAIDIEAGWAAHFKSSMTDSFQPIFFFSNRIVETYLSTVRGWNGSCISNVIVHNNLLLYLLHNRHIVIFDLVTMEYIKSFSGSILSFCIVGNLLYCIAKTKPNTCKVFKLNLSKIQKLL